MKFVDLRSHLIECQFAIDVALKYRIRLGPRREPFETQAGQRLAVVLFPFRALFLTDGMEGCRHSRKRLYFNILPLVGCGPKK
jgi:hypothetical protein